MNPLGDALGIIRKDWKLLAGVNALYLCVVIIGVAIALMSPAFHRAMVDYIGADTIAGSAGVRDALNASGALYAVGILFFSGFLDILIILIPSSVIPIWGPIFGASKFFIWGVAYTVPSPGGMTLMKLLPQYVLMLLQGEAYVIAIFACVRQLTVALASSGQGLRRALVEYVKAVFENLKLLLVVIVLLAIAALYQALLVPVLNGII